MITFPAARNGYPGGSFFEQDGFLVSVRSDHRFRRLVDELKAGGHRLRSQYREGLS